MIILVLKGQTNTFLGQDRNVLLLVKGVTCEGIKYALPRVTSSSRLIDPKTEVRNEGCWY